MSYLFGPRSQQPNRLGSVQIGTSEYGVGIPQGWGRFKAPIKLLDWINFSSQQLQSGGKGGSPPTGYEYYAAVDFFMVRGPVGGFGNVYDGGGGADLNGADEAYTIGGSCTYQASCNGYGDDAFYYDEGVTCLATFSGTANDFGSDGSVSITGTQAVGMEKVDGAPGPGEYQVTTTGLYRFNSADTGKAVTVNYTFTTADLSNINTGPGTNAPLTPGERYGIAFLVGNTPSQQWGYNASYTGNRALRYDGLARGVCQTMDLGQSATVPSLSIEILNGRLKAFGHGIGDCDPADVIADLLTDPDAGCNWPYLGDLTLFSNFCVAHSMFMSPFFDSVRKATEIVDELCDLTNSAAVWSGALLKIVPYGDTSAFANGRTFTPPTQPVYDVDDDECVCAAGEEPVTIGQPDLADNFNRIQFEWCNAADSYNTALMHEQDEASILMNGLLPMKTVTASHFKDQLAAAVAMGMKLRRNSTPLRPFKFSLPWYFQLLEPMDIMQLNVTLGQLGVTPIRIVSIEEQDDYTLQVEAEDFLYGIAEGVRYPKSGGDGNGPGDHDLPLATTLLASFMPGERITGGGQELWLALTGGPAWGGCKVWLSLDGITYGNDPIAIQYGSSRAGSLTAALAAVPDPDTSSTASVTLTGTLATVSATDANNFATLSLVGSELIAYETATLTSSTASSNSYGLTTLRRGVFSTPVQAHIAGEQFIRLDKSLCQWKVDPSLYGKTVYLKFTSFNLYGREPQAIGNVTAYPITLSGPGTGMIVSSFLNPGGGDCTVQAYRLGGTPGEDGTYTTWNGSTITLPAQTYPSEPNSTWIGINFDPSTGVNVLFASKSAWTAAQGAGQIPVGSTTTPAATAAGLLPTTFSDLGTAPTSNPTNAWEGAGLSATVQAGASISSPSGHPSVSRSNFGRFIVFGWAGVAATPSTLSVKVGVTVEGDTGASGLGKVEVSLDGGSTWAPWFSSAGAAVGTYTMAIASGQDQSQVQVSFSTSAHIVAGAGTGEFVAASTVLTVSELQIIP